MSRFGKSYVDLRICQEWTYSPPMRQVRNQRQLAVGVILTVFILLAVLLASAGSGAKASSSLKTPASAPTSAPQSGFLPIGSRARTGTSGEAQEIAQIRAVIIASHEDFLHKSFVANCALLSPGGQRFYARLFQKSTCPAALAFDYAQATGTPQIRKITVALLKDEMAADRKAPVSFRGSGITLTEKVHDQYDDTATVYTMQTTAHAPYWLIYGFDSNSSASIG